MFVRGQGEPSRRFDGFAKCNGQVLGQFARKRFVWAWSKYVVRKTVLTMSLNLVFRWVPTFHGDVASVPTSSQHRNELDLLVLKQWSHSHNSMVTCPAKTARFVDFRLFHVYLHFETVGDGHGQHPEDGGWGLLNQEEILGDRKELQYGQLFTRKGLSCVNWQWGLAERSGEKGSRNRRALVPDRRITLWRATNTTKRRAGSPISHASAC